MAKVVILMRKFLLGLLVGLMIAVAAPAYGAVSSLVGKYVQGEYPVKVDGSPLANKSIAIDGTTYAPLRAIGEAIGYDVTFQDKTVVFTKRVGVQKVETNTTSISSQISEIQSQIDELNKKQAELLKERFELELNNPNGFTNEQTLRYNEIKEERKAIQDQIKALEAQLQELESQQ